MKINFESFPNPNPKDCDEEILSKIIRRQDQFPPPICVISRVKFVELDLGIDEKIGLKVDFVKIIIKLWSKLIK